MTVTALMFVATLAHAAESPPRCPIQLAIHKDGAIAFDGKTYRIGAELKGVLVAYHKRHANCVMSNFTTEPNTNVKVVGETIIFLAGAGLLPDKVGILMEPSNAQ
jgi:hypothetical protein